MHRGNDDNRQTDQDFESDGIDDFVILTQRSDLPLPL